MSRSGAKRSVGILLGRKLGASARQDIEWERIMVQITFAFVIILGYLISVEMQQSQQLAAEAKRMKDQNSVLNSIVSNIRDTEVGEERAKRVAAQMDLQLQLLLGAWDNIQEQRELYKALIYFDGAERIELADDLDSLPVDSHFDMLRDETARVFMDSEEKISSRVVSDLLRQSIVAAGLDPRPNAGEELPPDARDLYFNASVPTDGNRQTLKARIAGDLALERQQLVDIQCDLVDLIFDARLQKLPDAPLDEVEMLEIDGDDAEFGAAMLEMILDELGRTVSLLPETADMIRGVDVQEPEN